MYREIIIIIYRIIIYTGTWYRQIIWMSLSEPHTYRTAVQNPPYVYICVPLVRPSIRQFGPAKGPFKCAMCKCRTYGKRFVPQKYNHDVTNVIIITWVIITLRT